MIHDKKHLVYEAQQNESKHRKMVNRSLYWIDNSEEEQHKRQKKLKRAVAGVNYCE
ncbi:thiamine biosynthesis protein [Clostridium carboxidivorans P7]|uniref:Molybdopterin and thiamine biosynthesis dinucleotide-utilizing enzyme n=1 Tax=Clostridium carboxidivorans P7 TaxID=536227 RepID=C6PSQ9_9CLOT|nr:hypothetical protein [Clostridium carboxidivorans]AKN31639.1 thiamine biosynthesis protein [Clostridium carboxidivorans P7]EET87738.1 molybdopterin and thiamine biosynthesis dinucleotide-utilizing enzyme [Clostridium carboxidivorans P7]